MQTKNLQSEYFRTDCGEKQGRELFVLMLDSNCRNKSGNCLASGTVCGVQTNVQRKMLPNDYGSDC